ncbi:MAG: hypothetical protein P8X90_09330 [Desulfobacterales bacterium]|jgi:hypothetical protein
MAHINAMGYLTAKTTPLGEVKAWSFGLGFFTSNQNGEFRAMKIRMVTAIIQPFQDGVPLHPSVTTEERISRAIELMVTFNLKCIAVTRGSRAVGVIRLADAFREMGLQEAKK